MISLTAAFILSIVFEIPIISCGKILLGLLSEKLTCKSNKVADNDNKQAYGTFPQKSN